MPNTREKLIELLEKINGCCPKEDDCYHCKYEALDDCSVYAKADFLIANGVTVQKWIPVTERLPEKEGRYLCVVRISRKSGAVYVRIMNGDKHGFSLEHIYDDDVTHWMPLPQPPKG